MKEREEFIQQMYSAFNARDIDVALSAMHTDVEWPNGMEGGYVYGHDGVRAYWTRQWQQIDPHVDPVRIDFDESGRVTVEVHQVVKDLAGNIMVDGTVQHVYHIENGLIRTMEIRKG
jgi:hypothetical protein